MHPLLARQLKRAFGEGPLDPKTMAFAKAVSEAYEAGDDDRALLEHSLNLSSKELKERYDALQADIAERMKVENERDTFFRMSPDMLCVVLPDLSFKQVNPSWSRVLGYAEHELVGANLLKLIHDDDLSRTLEEAKQLEESGRTVGFENRYRGKDGRYHHISWTAVKDAKTGHYYAAARDITAQRSMEADLAQAQKLEAVGQLASGVAHEINTPVQFIGDNVQFVRDSLGDLWPLLDIVDEVIAAKQATPEQLERLETARDDADIDYLREELPRSLEEARDGVKRVAELVRALKEFAHPDQVEMSVADLNKAISRTLVLARNEVKYVANIETEFAELPAIECHQGAMNQVFLNLIVNAAHAIEDRLKKTGEKDGRGTIHVSTKVVDTNVVVAIRDTGCGIPLEIRQRIFEPFFTTKDVGKGTGQGLALARNIVVDKHHGSLDFESTVGEGTTFFIRLPLRQVAAPGRKEAA